MGFFKEAIQTMAGQPTDSTLNEVNTLKKEIKFYNIENIGMNFEPIECIRSIKTHIVEAEIELALVAKELGANAIINVKTTPIVMVSGTTNTNFDMMSSVATMGIVSKRDVKGSTHSSIQFLIEGTAVKIK
ncbi:hypothetical protein [Hydrogenimonas thermophila]|uniref:Uncharacterized protein n=1 Tax=Hydrogenimonas thermophila TaxID=223786 RepID=A0A1I5N5H1_9BACT|nr:hypothetical protein [Hydrogenimonas thermophila]WOE70257.1 hypothetical protein RZR91_01495 [Hydrogenimonas thermophila]WOE72774.1 hypothetical protein RZR97_01485 [Hydrogenimonas thermophila]SFP17058.1 hypothetical protein SAMN05216234_10868 [Hydrogenimonas thermophila]